MERRRRFASPLYANRRDIALSSARRHGHTNVLLPARGLFRRTKEGNPSEWRGGGGGFTTRGDEGDRRRAGRGRLFLRIGEKERERERNVRKQVKSSTLPVMSTRATRSAIHTEVV